MKVVLVVLSKPVHSGTWQEKQQTEHCFLPDYTQYAISPLFLWSINSRNCSVRYWILKRTFWNLVLQTKCHRIDRKCTLVVDSGKFGQLNGNLKVYILHLREKQLSKILTSIKGRFDFCAPHLPSEETVEQNNRFFQPCLHMQPSWWSAAWNQFFSRKQKTKWGEMTIR